MRSRCSGERSEKRTALSLVGGNDDDDAADEGMEEHEKKKIN
mgnify:CR=1 FL=1